MDHESFWDACICSLWSVEHRSARHQTKFHMAENREVDRSQGKGGFIKLPIVFQRQIIHGVQLTIWSTSLFSYCLWSNKQNLVMFEWDESVVVLPAPVDWPHWKLSRLIITPMAEPGSQPYVYSAVLWLQTQHTGWTRRRALATFYSDWELGGNNNLGNRLSEVTDQHNTPKRTFVRLWLWCLFKENNHQCPLLIRQ